VKDRNTIVMILQQGTRRATRALRKIDPELLRVINLRKMGT